MSRKLLMNNYSENGLSPVMDGLICWLDGRDGRNGDTVWKDRSGNGNNAIFINNKTIFNGGKLTLNGDNYADLPFGNNEDINKYSICAYVSKSTTYEFNDMVVAHDLNTGTRKYLSLQYPRPRIGYATTYYAGNISININKLNYLVFNIGQQASLYINNELSTSVNIVENTISKSNLIIGAERRDIQSCWLKGNIASILIYNRALTEEEVQQNYLYEQSIKRGE